jgi:hypothetical protein
VTKSARQNSKRRPKPSPAATTEAATPASTKTTLSPNRQSALLVRYHELPTGREEHSAALRNLCAEFEVGLNHPARLLRQVRSTGKLPTRKGAGGRTKVITEAEEERIMELLDEEAYDITFAQMEEQLGIPASTIWRHFKETPGWRVSRKGTKPHLTPNHVADRFAWSKKHKTNKWRLHVDMDEKWFYVYSHSGKLKLYAGMEKPRTPIKSKRFIGKVMMLIAIARPVPEHDFDGKIGCWRVTDDFVYKKGATYQGTRYEKGDTRRKDCTMDGAKFAEMLKDDVFPSIRAKMSWAKEVKVQWDNATPHTAETMETIVGEFAAPMRRGKAIGPKLTRVKQCAQSPETNTLDLGFNNSLDSRLPKKRSFDLDEFEQQVLEQFNDYPMEKLDDLFDMKQRVTRCILDSDPPGGNNFTLPHRKKAKH